MDFLEKYRANYDLVFMDIEMPVMDGMSVRGTGTMKKICELLEGLPFALCNQCYLVNLAYVSGIDGNVVCVGDERLQISAPKRKKFLCALNNYLGAGGGGL